MPVTLTLYYRADSKSSSAAPSLSLEVESRRTSAINFAAVSIRQNRALIYGRNWVTGDGGPWHRNIASLTLKKPSSQTHRTLGLGFMGEKLRGKFDPTRKSFDQRASPLDQARPKIFTNLNFDITGDPISGKQSADSATLIRLI